MRKIATLVLFFMILPIACNSADRIESVCSATALKIFEACDPTKLEDAIQIAGVYCDDFMRTELILEDYQAWTATDAQEFCDLALRLEAQEIIESGHMEKEEDMVTPEEEKWILANLEILNNDCERVSSYLWNELLEFPGLIMR